MSDREKAHVFLMALKNRKGHEDRQRAVEVLIANIRASERRHAENDFMRAAREGRFERPRAAIEAEREAR